MKILDIGGGFSGSETQLELVSIFLSAELHSLETMGRQFSKCTLLYILHHAAQSDLNQSSKVAVGLYCVKCEF